MKVKLITVKNLGLLICLIYILLRPFLNTYVTEYIKYIFILVMVYFAEKGITSKRILKEIGYGVIVICGLFSLYALISSLMVGGFELATYSLERYVFYMIPLFVVPTVQKRVDWDSTLNFLTWYGVVDALISITEFVIHRQLIPIEGVTHSVVQQFGDNSIRTFGLNGDYFLLAELLCFCGFAALYMYCNQKKKIHMLKFIIISIGIFTTGSRGYYVAFAIGLGVFYILYNLNLGKPKKFLFKMGIAFVIVIIALLVVFMTDYKTGINGIDTVLARARSIVDFSGNYANAKRLQHWVYSINKWKTHPLLGNGASITDIRYTHFEMVTESGLFKRLVELGIIGTVLQYLSMIVLIVRGYRLFRKTNVKDNLLYIFFFAVIATLATEDMVLQRYGEIEFTIVIWSALAFVGTYKKSKFSKEAAFPQRNDRYLSIKQGENGLCR